MIGMSSALPTFIVYQRNCAICFYPFYFAEILIFISRIRQKFQKIYFADDRFEGGNLPALPCFFCLRHVYAVINVSLVVVVVVVLLLLLLLLLFLLLLLLTVGPR
jgi:hypothetical protein